MQDKKTTEINSKAPLLARKFLKNLDVKVMIAFLIILAIGIQSLLFPLFLNLNSLKKYDDASIFALSLYTSMILMILIFIILSICDFQKLLEPIKTKQEKVWLEFYGVPMNDYLPSNTNQANTTTESEETEPQPETLESLPQDIKVTISALLDKITLVKSSDYIKDNIESMHFLEEVEKNYIPDTVKLFKKLSTSRQRADSEETLEFKASLDKIETKVQTYIDAVDNWEVSEFKAQLSFVNSVIE